MQEAKQQAPQIDFAQAPIPSTNYSGSYCGLGGPCGLLINSNHCAGHTGRAKYFSGSINGGCCQDSITTCHLHIDHWQPLVPDVGMKLAGFQLLSLPRYPPPVCCSTIYAATFAPSPTATLNPTLEATATPTITLPGMALYDFVAAICTFSPWTAMTRAGSDALIRGGRRGCKKGWQL